MVVGVPAAIVIAGVVAFFVAREPAAVQIAADAEPEMSMDERIAAECRKIIGEVHDLDTARR